MTRNKEWIPLTLQWGRDAGAADGVSAWMRIDPARAQRRAGSTVAANRDYTFCRSQSLPCLSSDKEAQSPASAVTRTLSFAST